MKLFSKARQLLFGDLSCERVNAFLDDYIEGALPPETSMRFETHLRRCPQCETHLGQYKQTIDLLQTDGAPDIPPALVDHTLAFLRENMKP